MLATGLAAAVMVATINPAPAQAFPNKQQDCTGCHGSGTVSGTVTAVPSMMTQAAGAAYTVLVTAPANAAGGDTGFWIANSTATGTTGTTTGVYGGYAGTSAATYTAAMTAPAAAGTYYYKVWAVHGPADTSGVTNFALYSITVGAMTTTPPTTVPPTTVPPTTVPPTTVPPTTVPPTTVPPTTVPPTAVPPTAVPPTAVPPTAVPPTAVPPTAVGSHHGDDAGHGQRGHHGHHRWFDRFISWFS